MQAVLDALRSAEPWLAVVALLFALVALVLAVVAVQRSGGRGAGPGPLVADADLDRLLASQMQRLDGVADELRAQGARLRYVEADGRHAVQRIGLVRFNPFEDTGGNQSFAIALLDADANGVVLSSLHSRQSTRVYVKAVVGGRCDAALSAEETEALRQAGLNVGG